MTKNTKTDTEKGFTLVEIAVVMLISGLILAVFVSAYLRWKDILQTSQTRENIAIIADAMSAYVSRNYRIPCPANPAGAGSEPFGAEMGSGATGASIGTCPANNQWEGLVPFATLGLDATFARDGWGNYLTYQVSPLFTADMDVDPDSAGAPSIHAKCRTTDWIEGSTLVGSSLEGGRNTHHRKAHFCCAQPDVNVLQVFTTPAPDNNPTLIINPDGNNWYDTANELADPNDSAEPVSGGVGQPFYNNLIYGGGLGGTSGHTDMIVYTVTSHGKTGDGAFLEGGGRTTTQGASENVNASTGDAPGLAGGGADGIADQVVYDLPHNSTTGVNFYDDIVSWQTQSNLMARLRRDSCALP